MSTGAAVRSISRQLALFAKWRCCMRETPFAMWRCCMRERSLARIHTSMPFPARPPPESVTSDLLRQKAYFFRVSRERNHLISFWIDLMVSTYAIDQRLARITFIKWHFSMDFTNFSGHAVHGNVTLTPGTDYDINCCFWFLSGRN